MVVGGKEVPGRLIFEGQTAIRAIAEMNKMDGDYLDPSARVQEEPQSERIRRLASLDCKYIRLPEQFAQSYCC